MHTNRGLRRLQQHQVGTRGRSVQAYDFFNLLTGPQLLDQVEQQLPAHRERVYAPIETLSLFMTQALSADGSCQAAVDRHSVERMVNGLPPCSTSTGAYCKARQRLPLTMIQSLTRQTGALMAASALTPWRWQGRTVKLLDGTTVTLADTSANQEDYPQQSNQKPGLGFPIARVVGLLCMATGAVLDASMGPYSGKKGSEHALLREMLDSICAQDVVVADCYYCAYFLIALLSARGADVLFQQHQRRITDFRRGHRLGSKDHVVLWHKPVKCPDWLSQSLYDSFPQTQLIREVRVKSKVLVTTMLSTEHASRKALGDLYARRWDIELDLRNIKTTLGLEVLHCKTPQMSEKELWSGLLAYNLIRLLMTQSAKRAQILPRHISFKHTVQIWLAWSHYGPPDTQRIDGLLALIAQQRVGQRPGRVEPRALKRRPRPFPLLTIPRAQARAKILRHGHPKKLK